MALIGPGGRPVTSAKPAAPSGPASPNIKDSGLETFAADVIEASREVPVIVDFWAPWCGPCKTLGPVLEKVVTEAKGAVKLVKVNIDENQEIARQLRIQSIPTVYRVQERPAGRRLHGRDPREPGARNSCALVSTGDGRMAGHDHAEEVLAAAEEAFAAGDVATGGAGLCPCAAGRARASQGGGGPGALLSQERRSRTRQADLAARAPRRRGRRGDARGGCRIEAARTGGSRDAGGLDAAAAKIDADPERSSGALTIWRWRSTPRATARAPSTSLLDIVRRDRKWNEDAARKHLVTLFEAMGPTDPRTIDGAAQAFLHPVLVRRTWPGAIIDRRSAPHAGHISADRRAAAAARAIAAQRVRAALSGAGGDRRCRAAG